MNPESPETAAQAERERRFREQVTVRNVRDYVARLAPVLRENFKAAIDQINDQYLFCSDFKVGPTDLAWTTRGEGEQRVDVGWFDMPLAWLLAAGVPRALIECDGGYTLTEPVDPAMFLRGWIEIRGGSSVLWQFGRAYFINPDEPSVLYVS